MKLFILGDLHFGEHNDSTHFQEYTKTFFDAFFDKVDGYSNVHIIQLGDIFDRRKYINFNTLKFAQDVFFDRIKDREIPTRCLVGNHDAYFKNTLRVNSLDLLLRDCEHISVVSTPSTFHYDNLAIDFIPWICDDNREDVLRYMKNSKSSYCMGHFELAGFEMHRGNVCEDGMNASVLKGYERVFSGHFHTRSGDGKSIMYVGTPYEMTWADCDDYRGYYILDTDTEELEFVWNPNKLYYKVKYETPSMCPFNFSDKIVRVMHTPDVPREEFDAYVNAIALQKPYKLTVVENPVDYSAQSAQIAVDTENESTPAIIDRFLDSVDMPLDRGQLKRVMRDLYVEARTNQ